jgi:MFS family permease
VAGGGVPEPALREAVLGYSQAFSATGGFILTGTYYLASTYGGRLPEIRGHHSGWRYVLLFGVCPAIPLIFVRPFLPEPHHCGAAVPAEGSDPALKETGAIPYRVRIRSSKYLNNIVEQDHRRIKQRVRPMLGFKRFDTAAVTITGIELAEKIKKDQFKIGKLPGRPATTPEIWAALLAA